MTDNQNHEEPIEVTADAAEQGVEVDFRSRIISMATMHFKVRILFKTQYKILKTLASRVIVIHKAMIAKAIQIILIGLKLI